MTESTRSTAQLVAEARGARATRGAEVSRQGGSGQGAARLPTEPDGNRAGTLDLHSLLLGGWTPGEGKRPSYGSLRCGLNEAMARELRQAHLEAIRRLAAGALAALDHGDQRETARLAMAAGRLCEEIAGRWTRRRSRSWRGSAGRTWPPSRPSRRRWGACRRSG